MHLLCRQPDELAQSEKVEFDEVKNGVFSTGDCCIPGYFQEQGQNFKLPGIKVGGWAQGRRQLGMQRESRDLCRKGANWLFIKHLTHQ